MRPRVVSGAMLALLLVSMHFVTLNMQVFASENVCIRAEGFGNFGMGSGDDWWPMFHHDLMHSGHSTSEAPNKNYVLWNYTTGDYVDSSPSVIDGKVFVGSQDKNVYALNASTGALIWKYTTGYWVDSSPCIADGKVFVGSRDKNAYALNASTGALIWKYITGNWVVSSPCVVDGRVFVGSYDKNVYALNASTGALIWKYMTGSSIVWSSPCVADGKVFIGSGDQNVYALNASTGTLIWNYTTGSWVWSSPSIANGKVFVGSQDKNVYAFGSHNIAITNVTTSATKTLVGQIINITVVAANNGTETETFDVTAYYNTTAIETKEVTSLASNTETTLTFIWNTTGVYASTYIISAQASIISGEINTSDNTYIDGTVQIMKHPVARFTYLPDYPVPNHIVTFNGSLSTPDGGTIISYAWSFGDGNSTNVTDPIITHIYNAFGTYNITLAVTDSEELNNTTWKSVPVYTHDIAIANATISKTVIAQGRDLKIKGTVMNQGDLAESFNVTIYANTTIIATFSHITLSSGNSTVISFAWSTVGVAKGNYTIKAVADTIIGETDTADNTCIAGAALVTISGDVTGDFKVDIFDIVAMALCFGAKDGMPPPPGVQPYNPNADIIEDGVIDVFDLVRIGINFGMVDP